MPLEIVKEHTFFVIFKFLLVLFSERVLRTLCKWSSATVRSRGIV